MSRETRRTFAVALSLTITILLAFSPTDGFSASKPEGTLVVAWDSLREESFLPWVGTAGQCDWWEIIYEYPFYLNLKTEEYIPGLALRYEYSKNYSEITINFQDESRRY